MGMVTSPSASLLKVMSFPTEPFELAGQLIAILKTTSHPVWPEGFSCPFEGEGGGRHQGQCGDTTNEAPETSPTEERRYFQMSCHSFECLT